ncbi:hypothetical protein MMC09_004277 [Bachmanniomyces sp. S44760]|nr:hypothetical protein [Bachmanniomyces sp. S44760]
METYNGHVRTPADAIILFEACRLGLLPRVQRRLSEKERQSIKSGSVFVWDEREAGMRRWTDGKSWSASRVSGSFLTYREMEGKRGGSGFASTVAASRTGKTPDSTRGSDSDLDMAAEDGPDGYRYKPDGLMKQSFSITTSTGNHLHLISYYARAHPTAQGLTQPTNDPALRHIRPQKGMYPESTVHEQQNIPAVTRSPMQSGPLAQVPQMAGYARPGPAHPLNYPQSGYSWPSPPNPQHQNGLGYTYGPSNLPPPPPPGYGTHPPLSYSQNAPPPSQTPSNARYERSSVPPTNLPRPGGHHRNSSSGSYPQFAPNGSPRVGHSAPPAPQQYSPQQPLPYTHNPSSTPPHQPSSTPPLSKIDPRLMAPSPLVQQQTPPDNIKPATSRTPTPQLPTPQQAKREYSHTPPPSIQNRHGISQANTIPSIGALMNGSLPAPVDNSDTRSELSNRSSSRSPGGTKREGPQDIPNEKLGFGEDIRALKILDRAFKT